MLFTTTTTTTTTFDSLIRHTPRVPPTAWHFELDIENFPSFFLLWSGYIGLCQKK